MDEERQSGYQEMHFDVNSLSAARGVADNKPNGAEEAFVKAVTKHATESNLNLDILVLILEKYCFENLSCPMLGADRSLVGTKMGKFDFRTIEELFGIYRMKT